MQLAEIQKMRGTLQIVVVEVASGKIVETRRVPNLITTAGKKLIANLLMGKIEGVPHSWAIAVGKGNQDPTITDTRLTAEVDRANAQTTVEVVTVETDEMVRAMVKAQLPPLGAGDEVQPLVEAGIVISSGKSKETLLNRVTFAQVSRGPMMVLNLAWEISF